MPSHHCHPIRVYEPYCRVVVGLGHPPLGMNRRPIKLTITPTGPIPIKTGPRRAHPWSLETVHETMRPQEVSQTIMLLG
jgi:hypothetical protein